MASKRKDLEPTGFPHNLNWKQPEAKRSLQRLHSYVTSECKNAIEWYQERKNKKKFAAYYCRVGAILTGMSAGVIPVLGPIFDSWGLIELDSTWATVAIAVAATLILIDKFGGFSIGWIRYVQSSQELVRYLAIFQGEWELKQLEMQHRMAETGELRQSIELCRSFLLQVYSVVEKETDQWAQEFRRMLNEMNEETKDSKGPN